MAAVNPAAHSGRPTLPIAAAGRSLPRAKAARRPAAVNGQHCPGQGQGMEWQQQRGGRRYAGIDGGGQSCCCPLRPANSAQGSILAAFFALGKAREWRRSTLLLPLPAAAVNGQHCPGQGQGMEWARQQDRTAAVNPAAHCGRSMLPWAAYWRRSLPRAREWIGSSARAARRPAAVNGQLCPGQGMGKGMAAVNFAQGNRLARAARPPICRNRRRRSTLLLPAAVLCPGQGKGMDWQGQQDRTAGRRR